MSVGRGGRGGIALLAGWPRTGRHCGGERSAMLRLQPPAQPTMTTRGNNRYIWPSPRTHCPPRSAIPVPCFRPLPLPDRRPARLSRHHCHKGGHCLRRPSQSAPSFSLPDRRSPTAPQPAAIFVELAVLVVLLARASMHSVRTLFMPYFPRVLQRPAKCPAAQVMPSCSAVWHPSCLVFPASSPPRGLGASIPKVSKNAV